LSTDKISGIEKSQINTNISTKNANYLANAINKVNYNYLILLATNHKNIRMPILRCSLERVSARSWKLFSLRSKRKNLIKIENLAL